MSTCEVCKGKGKVTPVAGLTEPCPWCQPEDGDRPPPEERDNATFATGGEEGEAEDLLAELRNGAWLDAQDFPPLVYHLPGVIPEGLTLLVGPPKIGKSWFVLTLALAVAQSAGKALGLDVELRPVLYLALEDGDRRMKSRCRTLSPGAPIPPGFDYLTRVKPGKVITTIRAWMARHEDKAPLVILDTLGKVMPPALQGESSYQRDYRVGDALKALADDHPGSCVLVNHHDRKAMSDDFVEKVSGTNGLAGSADSIIVLARGRHDTTGLISVTGRDVPEGEYAVTFDGARGLWSLDGDSLDAAAAKATVRRATAGLSDRTADVITLVNERPEGVKAAHVAEALDIDEGQARQYLSRLFESGRIDRPRRGIYTPVANVALSRPQQEGDPR